MQNLVTASGDQLGELQFELLSNHKQSSAVNNDVSHTSWGISLIKQQNFLFKEYFHFLVCPQTYLEELGGISELNCSPPPGGGQDFGELAVVHFHIQSV